MTLAKIDSPLPLVNHFLIAMPQLNNSYFANTVIYMWQHNSEGALGLVINLPIKMRMTDIFEQLGLTDLRMSTDNPFILSGGPVETDKGFVLHDADPRWPSSLAVTENLSITTSRDILAARPWRRPAKLFDSPRLFWLERRTTRARVGAEFLVYLPSHQGHYFFYRVYQKT